MGSTLEMIDLHCHLLPGLDDGPQTMDEAIQMCQMAFDDGIRTIVATPHVMDGVFQNNRSMILKRVEELYSNLRRQHSELQLNVLPGADVHLNETILQQIHQGEAVTVGDLGKYVLVEFPFQAIPFQAEKVLFQILDRGWIPILTHPERNLEVMRKPERYYEMIRMGCLGQVTAMSLTGEFGSKVKEMAEILMKNHLVHFIASDAHSIDRRPPILSSGVKAAEKMVGKTEAKKMVSDYPRAVLEGKKLDLPDPLPVESSKRRRWWT